MIPRVSLMEIRFPEPFHPVIYKISFSAVCFHLLNKLLSIFCRMKLKESLSEASGEGRCRLSDSSLCTGKFSCEARQEVVLSLLRCKNRYWRQYAESICGKEDYVLSCRSCGNRTNDIVRYGRSDRKHECSLLRSCH